MKPLRESELSVLRDQAIRFVQELDTQRKIFLLVRKGHLGILPSRFRIVRVLRRIKKEKREILDVLGPQDN